MKLTWLMIGCAATMPPSAVNAQIIRESSAPAVGIQSVAAVGNRVFERTQLSIVPAYEILDGFDRRNMFARVVVEPGTKFIAVEAK